MYAQAIDCLKGVDLAFNNFLRDFRLGAKKVFYNRSLTKTVGRDAEGNPVFIAPDDMMQQLFVSVGYFNTATRTYMAELPSGS